MYFPTTGLQKQSRSRTARISPLTNPGWIFRTVVRYSIRKHATVWKIRFWARSPDPNPMRCIQESL